ncbi:MAG: hypothetical protein GYA48_14845 [Chloroflexi bacterium]|nr:hypothetical protein [Chloroflexota bacterium]
MTAFQKKLALPVLLLMTLSLVSCAAPAAPAATAEPQPTVDMPALQTEVAATVIADITQQALAQPAADQVEPTATQPAVATATEAPTPTAIATLAPLPTATKRVVSSGGGAPAPTWTPASSTDQAVLVSNRPADYSYFQGGEAFDGVFTIKNVGRRDWNNRFYVTGTDFQGNKVGPILLSGAAVGDTVEIIVDLTAPDYVEGGKNFHTATFNLYNDDGVSILSFYLIINVEK